MASASPMDTSAQLNPSTNRGLDDGGRSLPGRDQTYCRYCRAPPAVATTPKTTNAAVQKPQEQAEPGYDETERHYYGNPGAEPRQHGPFGREVHSRITVELGQGANALHARSSKDSTTWVYVAPGCQGPVGLSAVTITAFTP